MQKRTRKNKKQQKKWFTIRKVNTFLATAVVILASVSFYTASTHSTANGNKTVSQQPLAGNPEPPKQTNPVQVGESAKPSEQVKPSDHQIEAPASPSPSPEATYPPVDQSASAPVVQPTTAPHSSGAPQTSLQPASSSPDQPAASTEVQGNTGKGVKPAGSSVKPPLEPSSVTSKTVYLTFDDGPSRYSDQIAAILKKNDIHATFFAIGGNLKTYPKQVNRLLSAGHFVGLHSMSHSYNKLYKSGSSANFINEFKQEQALFKKVTGKDVDLIRAPYGSAPQIDKQFRDDIAAAGFKMWDWTVDSEDWSYKNHPEKIIAQVKHQVHGHLNVILMHETKQTVDALPQVISYLKNKGYSFAVYKPESHLVVNFAHDDRL